MNLDGKKWVGYILIGILVVMVLRVGYLTYIGDGKKMILDTPISFDGVKDYLKVNTLSPKSPFSVSAWVKPAKTQVQFPEIISSSDFTGLTGFNLYLNNREQRGAGAFIVRQENANWTDCMAVGTTPLLDTKWHHLVGMYDGKQASIYVDGKLEDTDLCTGNGIYYGENHETWIGSKKSRQAIEFYNGEIKQVQLFNDVLNESQIIRLLNSQL